MRIVYVGLEPYPDRYTLQLTDWNIHEFTRLGVDYILIEGHNYYRKGGTTVSKIETGVVLDAHARALHAIAQITVLVELAKNRQLSKNDFIFFEDMFHPGIEALAYVFMQQWPNKCDRPKIGMRCLAQSIDPDDFIHYTGMAKWMRHYEAMVNSFVDVIFMNSEEMLPFATAAGWEIPCIVTGNAFGKQEVIERLGEPVREWTDRFSRVVFASRIANEKQFEFFIALSQMFAQLEAPVEFAFVSGSKISNIAIDRAVIYNKNLHVYPMCSKQEYYKLLNNSRVLFNCALQDWVSITIPEADALGCNVVAPAYHSMPEVFCNDEFRLYVPWSLEDAKNKVWRALESPNPHQGEISAYQDKSIQRTIEAIQEFMQDSETSLAFNPQDTSYRKYITNRAI